jgi:uncharacterized membrane protein YraQ (UPF0718 family)
MKEKEQSQSLKQAIKNAFESFLLILPMIFAVILLVALFQTYISPDMITKLFGYGIIMDIGTGTLFGAISSGNSVMSYIIAEELINNGVTLYAVTAFILSWVTLGIIQLPAEVSVFGLRFTLYKNLLTLLSTILVTLCTITTLKVLF